MKKVCTNKLNTEWLGWRLICLEEDHDGSAASTSHWPARKCSSGAWMLADMFVGIGGALFMSGVRLWVGF